MKLSVKQLKSLLKKARVQGNNIYGLCPYCGHDEFGLSINKPGHVWGCFRKKECGESGNIKKLLKHLKREDLLEGFVDVFSANPFVDIGIEGLETKSEIITKELPDISLPIGYKRLNGLGGSKQEKYLIQDRGFGESDFERYEVGAVRLEPKYMDYVVFPVRENGKIKGLVGRNYTNKDIMKYNNSSSDFSQMVYGLDEIRSDTHTVIIVEGIFDKRGVDLNFCDENEGFLCICTFGAKISQSQIEKILGKNKSVEVVLCFEQDVVKFTKEHCFRLETKFQKVRVGLPEEGRDPGEMSALECSKMILEAKSPIEFFTEVVENKLN